MEYQQSVVPTPTRAGPLRLGPVSEHSDATSGFAASSAWLEMQGARVPRAEGSTAGPGSERPARLDGRLRGRFLRFDGGPTRGAGAGPGILLVGEPAPAALADQVGAPEDMPHCGGVAFAVAAHAAGIGLRAADGVEEDSAHGPHCARPADRSLSAKRIGATALCAAAPPPRPAAPEGDPARSNRMRSPARRPPQRGNSVENSLLASPEHSGRRDITRLLHSSASPGRILP